MRFVHGLKNLCLNQKDYIKMNVTKSKINSSKYIFLESLYDGCMMRSRAKYDKFPEKIILNTRLHAVNNQRPVCINDDLKLYDKLCVFNRANDSFSFENQAVHVISDSFGYCFFENKPHIFFDNNYNNCLKILSHNTIYTKRFFCQKSGIALKKEAYEKICVGALGGRFEINSAPIAIEQTFFQIYKNKGRYFYNIFSYSEYKKQKIDPFDNAHIFIGNSCDYNLFENDKLSGDSLGGDGAKMCDKLRNDKLLNCKSLEQDIIDGQILIKVEQSGNVANYASCMCEHVFDTNIVKILFKKVED